MTDLSTFDTITKWLQQGATWAGSVVAIMAALSVVCKPIREGLITVIHKIWKTNEKNKELVEKIDDMKKTFFEKIDTVESTLSKEIKEVSNRNDKNEKNRIRWEILDFANSCKNGRRHTKDEYKHIIELHDTYEELLGLTGEQNGFLDAEYDYIRRQYAERQDKNDFLT